MNNDRPIRVAIVGGGCASTAAAYELTRPELQGKYEVTIYQLGWRLGGKGASGRGPADRIEEHGLHLWMGFYENAFRLMRQCYEELGRDPSRCRIATWTDAFKPDNFNAVADWSPARSAWLPWKVNFPPLPGMPGDVVGEYRSWTMTDYMVRTVVLLRTLFEAIQVRSGASPTVEATATTTSDAGASASTLASSIGRLLRLGQLVGMGALLEAFRLMEAAIAAVPQLPDSVLLRFQDLLTRGVRNQLEALIARDDEARRLWEIADLSLAVVRGAIRHRLMTDPRGFDAINDFDCREWLMLNGASRASVNSAFIRALYDLAFAYEEGDEQRPKIAAGQALRGAVRAFFTYRGAFFWKMQSGMGDVVFAPLYEVLKRRGAKFEFFHRLENVKIGEGDSRSDGRPHVSTLEFDVQARCKQPGEYQPLVDVRGLPCWPSQPDWSQLQGGEALEAQGVDFECHWDRTCVETKRLAVGQDFDLVILGVGVGAIPHACKDLVAQDARWRAMVEQVKTVSTQAFQLWMHPQMNELGWTDGAVNISGFVEPFDTWADMSHLVPEESHPPDVRSIAYFCSALPDAAPGQHLGHAGYPASRREEVKRNAINFLEKDISHLWRGASHPRSGFRWEILAQPCEPRTGAGAGVGPQRFESQYWRANVSPTDRYVLSLPGSLQYRISPLDESYDNLTVCGDWTDCGFNEGCVEAAVMSGRLAAHALSKSPPLEEIIGYDHP